MKKKSKLVLQINQKAIPASPELVTGGSILLITPPIDESYWLLRVPVAKDQAVVAFPKFSTVGIGFQRERDWNTNLPYSSEAAEIYDHISHNKGCKASRGTCIEAIQMLRDKIRELKQNEYLELVKQAKGEKQQLDVIAEFLRKDGGWKIAEAIGR